MEIVDEVIREPTRKNRRMSILVREKVDNESGTHNMNLLFNLDNIQKRQSRLAKDWATRQRDVINLHNSNRQIIISVDPSSPAEVTRAKSRKENGTQYIYK